MILSGSQSVKGLSVIRGLARIPVQQKYTIRPHDSFCHLPERLLPFGDGHRGFWDGKEFCSFAGFLLGNQPEALPSCQH